MNVNVSTPGGPCSCLPPLLSTHEGDRQCAVCGASNLTNLSASIIVTMFKCRTAAASIHVCQRCVCSAACWDAFMQRLSALETIYGGVEKVPSLLPTKAQVAHFVARTQLGLVFCAGCMRHELRDGPTFLCCGKCERAAYCTRECQVTHWRKEHRAFCKTRPAPKTISLEGAKPPCRCLDTPEELHEVSAQVFEHCSAPGCFNDLCPPFSLHMHVVQCTRPDYKKEEAHTLAIVYCGIACRRRAQNASL